MHEQVGAVKAASKRKEHASQSFESVVRKLLDSPPAPKKTSTKNRAKESLRTGGAEGN